LQGKLRNFLYLVGKQGIGIITGLLTSIIWARYTEQEVFGSYKLLVTYSNIMIPLALVGMNESLLISSAKRYGGNLIAITKLKLYFSIGCIPIILFISFYYGSNKLVFWGLILYAFIFPLTQANSIWVNWLNGLGGFKELSIKVSFISIITLISFSFCILVLHETSLNIILLFIFGIPGLFSLLFLFHELVKQKNSITDKSTISYGFHVTAANFFQIFIPFDIIFLSYFVSIESVAIYSIALIIPKKIKILQSIFFQFFVPELYKFKNLIETWSYFKRKFQSLLYFYIFIGILGYLIIPSVISLLFGPKYEEAISYSKVLWLFYCISTPFSLLGDILKAQKKIHFLYYIYNGFPIFSLIVYFIVLNVRSDIWSVVYSKIFLTIFLSLIYNLFFYYYLKKET
jgi:O-antigen/teichoic acid export membrane protein